jgi:hypothetical protein
MAFNISDSIHSINKSVEYSKNIIALYDGFKPMFDNEIELEINASYDIPVKCSFYNHSLTEYFSAFDSFIYQYSTSYPLPSNILSNKSSHIESLVAEYSRLNAEINEATSASTLLELQRIINKIKDAFSRLYNYSKKLLSRYLRVLKFISKSRDLRFHIRHTIGYHFKNMSDCSGSDDKTVNQNCNSFYHLKKSLNVKQYTFNSFRQSCKFDTAYC